MKFKVEGDIISVLCGHGNSKWRRLARVFKHGHSGHGNYLDMFDKQYSQALVRQANEQDERQDNG